MTVAVALGGGLLASATQCIGRRSPTVLAGVAVVAVWIGLWMVAAVVWIVAALAVVSEKKTMTMTLCPLGQRKAAAATAPPCSQRSSNQLSWDATTTDKAMTTMTMTVAVHVHVHEHVRERAVFVVAVFVSSWWIDGWRRWRGHLFFVGACFRLLIQYGMFENNER